MNGGVGMTLFMTSQTLENQLNILDSIRSVIQTSKHVHINEDAIIEFADGVTDLYSKDLFCLNNASEEEQIAFAIIYGSVNSCFWGEPKWTIEVDGQKYDGSMAMFYALKNATQKYNLLNPQYLKNLSESDFKEILLGNVEIPLFQERLEIFRSIGQAVCDRFNGLFANIIKEGESDAVKIVDLLVKEMPLAFNDVVNYHGQVVKFYKKVQLVQSNLFELYKNNLISIPIIGMEKLTAFADYKVPQMLRQFNILEYSPELSEKVDNKIEIPYGSDEEIEIRASTVWAVELLTQKLKQKYPDIYSAKVNNILWHKGQEKVGDMKPYHRTMTIWY